MDPIPREGTRLANGLGALQLFIGVGAIGGGLALILGPDGANLGIPPELLNNTPFSTYLFPGIVLLVVNGLGSLAGAVASFARYRYAGEIAMVLGVFLVVWIILQVYWFAGFHWLHALYLALGFLDFDLQLPLATQVLVWWHGTGIWWLACAVAALVMLLFVYRLLAGRARWVRLISTLPIIFIRFLPRFCLSSNFLLRVISPP